MRLDVVLPNTGDYALEAVGSAARFEDMGYTGLWLTDHVLGIDDYAIYGDYWLEILAALAYLAGTTRTIRLGTETSAVAEIRVTRLRRLERALSIAPT